MGRMAATETTSVRPYRGVEPADRLAERRGRLLRAGLDLLGASEQDWSELTVRAICRQAGVTARYFYESFADKDAFVSAVFDWVVADLAEATQASVDAVPPDQQSRAGMANIVQTISGDPRVGRLLFSAHLSDPVLVRKRVESTALFATLLGRHAGQLSRIPENDRIAAAAHFVVGGVGQTISAWLAGAVSLTPDELVEQLTTTLDRLADPALYRD